MSALPSRVTRPLLAGVALVSAVHAVFFVQDAWIDRQLVAGNTARLRRELVYDQNKQVNHDQFARQLALMRPMLAHVEQRLPTHLDNASIDASLRAQAAQSNVELANLRIKAEIVKAGFYAERPVSLSVGGSTENVLAFMDQSLRSAPIHFVSEMQIAPNDRGRIEARIVMHYLHHIDWDE